MPAPAVPIGYKQPMNPITRWDKGVRQDPSNFPTLMEMKQWDKWKRVWMAMATAQLVEIVLDSNYKPQAGEEKLYCQQLTYVYKVLLNTVLESSLWAIPYQGDAGSYCTKDVGGNGLQGSTETKQYFKKIFDLPQYCYNQWWTLKRNQQRLSYSLV
jgi:hypothetical protein